jgi:hypothetical protein
MALQADYLELEMPELAEYLLREAGQTGEEPTNPSTLLEYLKLQFAVVDLAALLRGAKGGRKQPRGVLSYFDQIVGVDSSLRDDKHRARFTTMHEIGHYVLPAHRNALYICDDECLSYDAMIETETVANAFAAELLFKGDQFTRLANDCAVTPESIKTLAQRYDASFESTARRFVEKNARACSLVVFGPVPGPGVIDTTQRGRWQQKYSISSAEFRTRYSTQIRGDVPEDAARELTKPGRDFADAIEYEMSIPAATGEEYRLHVSFFTNYHCIFGLFQPATTGGR